MRGLFIVFVGTNGSGKTSISNNLLNKMNNSNYYKFPNRNTPSGIFIDKFLKKSFNFTSLDHQIKIFADNRREQMDNIKNDLDNGINVICDRYTYCNLAYTKQNNENITFDELMKYDKGLIKPDLVFLITGDHLHLRNDISERYHNKELNQTIINNYIDSFKYLDTLAYIIENKYGKLDKSVNMIFEIINNFEIFKNDPIKYF